RWAAGWARKIVRTMAARIDLDPTLAPFLASLAYYAVIAMVLIAVLGMIGIETASLLTVLGASALAIGLAMQGTLSNVAAGVMLLLFRPFRVGDSVDIGGTTGKVMGIRLFSTLLSTPDNVEITVPNAQIYGNTIKNFSANDTRRNDIVVGISYDDDIGLAIQTIEDVLARDDRVLPDPKPAVAVLEMADSSVNIGVRPWCTTADYWDLRCDLMRALKEQLETAGCSIPYPQTDVHLHQVG
ncbi:MAG: mechanosensitive ion channel, partial [Gemmatimonadetes bacterium]|nr:mechanosensitive ion channel [Gemmatimonadota bacterium]